MRLEVSILLNLSKIRYSVSQAKKNVVRNGLMSVASLFTITCCLLILGLFTIITVNVNSYTEQIKDQCEFQLFMNIGTSDERITQIGDEILLNPNVKEISIYTREEMYDYAMNDIFDGKEELIGTYNEEENPFKDSYKIVLYDITKSDQTATELTNIADVDHVEDKQDIANIVTSISSAVQKVSIAIMLILFIISLVIISNTVRLTVFNRRKEINIMKYIGATDRFIRTPFIIEGILIGFCGAIIAFGLVSWAYIALFKNFSASSFAVMELIPYSSIALLLGGLFVIFGCFIGIIGSAISMRKHLNV
jgi:cell division transport system permease protein